MSNPSPSLGNRPIDQLKVAELRDELRKRGLSLKGVKKELLERLEEAVRKEQTGFVEDDERQDAYPSQIPPDQDSVEASQDDDGMSYLNDAETHQDASLTAVNNASADLGASEATPTFAEPQEDAARVHSVEERMEDTSEAGSGLIAEIIESDKTLVDSENTVSTEITLVESVVESENLVIENVAELGKEGYEPEVVLGEPANHENVDPDAILPKDSSDGIVSQSATGEDGAPDGYTAVQIYASENLVVGPVDDTLSAPPVVGDVGALGQEISVPELASAVDVVIPPEGDDNVPNASVSDDILNAAGPSIVPGVETLVNANDCPMQDVEVFEETVLTSVSVVTCVQESGKESEDGAPKIGMFEKAKEELVEDDATKVLSQEECKAVEPLIAASESPHLEAAQELQVSELEGVDGSAAHLDSVPQEGQQDIEMSGPFEEIPAKPEDFEIKLPAAVLEAPVLPLEIKSENIDDTDMGDAGNLQEVLRVGNVDDHNFDVKSEPREAESRISRQAVAEIVKVEQQDIKEELFQKDINYERSRPRDYENDRPRDYENDRPRDQEFDRFKHSTTRAYEERGRAEGRSGRHFKEDGRKPMDETFYKPEDAGDVRTSQKRKDDDRDAKQQEPAKRVRRWNSGNQPATELAKPLTSGTVNEIVSPEVKREEFAVPPKPTTKLPGPSRPAPPAAKSGLEANGEKRTVPVSTRPPSASLKIERFVRPFTLKAVKDLLAQFGDCVDFWMDQIKTHCYVTFSKVEEAVAARNGLYDRQWPPSFGNLLIANFVDASEVKLRSEGTFEKTNAPALATPRDIPNHPPGLGAQYGHANALVSAPPLRERQLMPPTIKELEPPVPTLDDLFRKTKTKPHIYYLPLTDEQVAEKLAASKNEKLVAARNNNQQPIRGRPVGRV